MKHECSIVRDLLPLYVENMVSGDTASFVKEHLEGCGGCAAEYEKLRAGGELTVDGENAQQREDGSRALARIRRRLRNRTLIETLIAAAVILTVLTLLHFFPVYRIAEVGGMSYFDKSEVRMLAYIGTPGDRAAAQSVLRQADAAFNDLTHSYEENRALHGALGRYATPSHRGGVTAAHTLELWSAHLGDAEGYLWVYYSHEVRDSKGEVVCGSWRIPALWTVAKDDSGRWVVTGVKEHP